MLEFVRKTVLSHEDSAVLLCFNPLLHYFVQAVLRLSRDALTFLRV